MSFARFSSTDVLPPSSTVTDMEHTSRFKDVVIYLVSLAFGVALMLVLLHFLDSPPSFPHWTGAIPVIAGVVGSDLLQRWRRRRQVPTKR